MHIKALVGHSLRLSERTDYMSDDYNHCHLGGN